MLKINEVKQLYLGVQGESQEKTLTIDMNPWLVDYPNGTVSIWHRRNGDDAPTPTGAVLDRDSGVLSWTLTGLDTYVAGDGMAEIRLTENSVIKKTREVITTVSESVTGAGGVTGSGWQEYINIVEGYKNAAETAQDAAEDARDLAHEWATYGESSEEPSATNNAKYWSEQAEAAQGLAEDAQGAAEDARDLAHEWATYGESSETPSATNNAKYWAEQAEDSADDAAQAVQDAIDDTAGDGDTDKLWSANKIYDELALKAPKANPNFTGNSFGMNRYDTPGYASVAMGDNPTASGDWAVSLGYMNEATGEGSFAKNIGTWADGYGSDTSGIGTIAKHKAQHVFGQYNESTYEDESDDPTDPGTYIEMVGNGTSSNSSNARALDWNGNEKLAGDIFINCNDDSTGGTALGAEVASVKSSIGAVPSGKTVEGQISEIESTIGTVPTGSTVMGELSNVKSAINSDLKKESVMNDAGNVFVPVQWEQGLISSQDGSDTNTGSATRCRTIGYLGTDVQINVDRTVVKYGTYLYYYNSSKVFVTRSNQDTGTEIKPDTTYPYYRVAILDRTNASNPISAQDAYNNFTFYKSNGALDAVKSEIDSVRMDTTEYRKLYLFSGGVYRGSGELWWASPGATTSLRIKTTYIKTEADDYIYVPSGYLFSFFYYSIVDGALTYVGNSYDNDGGLYNGGQLKRVNHNGMVIVALGKNNDAYITKEECFNLNLSLVQCTTNGQFVDGIPVFPGSISTSSQDEVIWTEQGYDYRPCSNDGRGTSIYLNYTRYSTSKFDIKKNATIAVADGYRVYIAYYSGDTQTGGNWNTGKITIENDSTVRLVIDTTNISQHTPYTQWPSIDSILTIVNDKSVIDIEEEIKELNNDIAKLDTKTKGEELYIGSLVNAHLTASGLVDDNFTNYRISSENTIALPCGSKRKLKVHINERYLFAMRVGATATNLSSNLCWYSEGDEITIPDGCNYYAVSICRNSGDSSHLQDTISPSDDTGVSITFENYSNVVATNEEAQKILTNAKLYFSASNLNTLDRYAIIAHTSDCHGDYKRVGNFLDFCDQVGVDVACVTGDVVSYKPSNGIKWFSELLNSHITLPAICTGNHDVYDNNMDDDDIYDFMFADVTEKIGNATGKTWYYKDIASKKIRIISVNLYQYGGESRWYTHFTEEQLSWLVSTLASTPNDYGVIILSHASQVTLDSAKDANYPTFFQDARLYNNTHNAVSGGIPLYDIVDAFISRGTLSKTYTQTGSPSSVSVSADFSNVDSSVEFIAHLTGHFHQDSVCYVHGRTNKQLMLNVTCTIAAFGGSAYPYLADIQDQGRNIMDASQDAFNVYVIDRDNKVVKIVRVGQNMTYQMNERKYMSIPYAD